MLWFFADMRKKVTLPAVNHRTNISDHGRIGSKFIAVILTAISWLCAFLYKEKGLEGERQGSCFKVFFGSPGKIRTCDTSVNSRVLLPLSYWGIKKCGNVLISRFVSKPVLPALQGLTSVFGMRTGGSPAIWSPQVAKCVSLAFFAALSPICRLAHSQLPVKQLILYMPRSSFLGHIISFPYSSSVLWSNLSTISIIQLNTLLYLHPWPINLIVFKESNGDIWSWGGFHA